MRLLLADDHPLFREGLKPVLAKLDPALEIVEAIDYPSAFAAMHAAGEVDLALIDLYMPGMLGVDGVMHFRSVFPAVPLVVVSAATQAEDIHALLIAGALGYICKSEPSEVILGALRLVLAGGVYIPSNLIDYRFSEHELNYPASLTRRQLDTLVQLAKGKTNRQIADSLKVTEGTAKIHVAAIFRVLKVSTRTEAVLAAQKMGLDDTH